MNVAENEPGDGSLSIASPISLAVLEQWSRYATYCLTLTRQIDWRDIFAFLDDDDNLQCHSYSSSVPSILYLVPLGTLGTEDAPKFPSHSPIHRRPCKAFKKAVENMCQRRFGEGAVRFHQQRLFRWTRTLAQGITRRLSDIIENKRPVSSEELLAYRIVFASRAARVVGAVLFLRSLLALLEIAECQEMLQFSRTNSTDLLNGHSHLSEPTSLPPSLALTMPFSSSLSVEEYSMTQCLPALLSQSLNALWMDGLHISHELVDPIEMLHPVIEQVSALLSDERQVRRPLLEERHLIFSSTLRPLMIADEPTKRKSYEKSSLRMLPVSECASPLKHIQAHQLSTALRVLETVGYIMITKVRVGHVGKCYEILPLLSEYNVLISIMKKKCETMPEMLSQMYEQLFKSTELLYTECVGEKLNRYRKSAFKYYVRIGHTAGRQSVPMATISILYEVVEPTFAVLSMIGSFTLSTRYYFVRRVVDMMADVIKQLMLDIERDPKTMPALKERCMADRSLIMEFIDAHPVSMCLRHTSVLTNTSDKSQE